MPQENYIIYGFVQYIIKTVISIHNLLRFMPHYLNNNFFYEHNGATRPLQFSCYENVWIKIIYSLIFCFSFTLYYI